ncbi:hypothetical protein A1O1_08609 [Capronia coronata CBS 617.96]|uniref:Uncharacterized protein n=1 Tax=Capronia coronata CBS 617.96 TaxID=1182541 RepID=W9YDT2_9EURO|nr:uncharacterized protein A1O1_08609 [Capronia coronata CBS 617.96]EXJ80464.1 hypothetical protein A1O1_08609 [Capronia coronata CBS 617.96]
MANNRISHGLGLDRLSIAGEAAQFLNMQTAFQVPPPAPLSQPSYIHLGIGQFQESYERTRLEGEEEAEAEEAVKKAEAEKAKQAVKKGEPHVPLQKGSVRRVVDQTVANQHFNIPQRGTVVDQGADSIGHQHANVPRKVAFANHDDGLDSSQHVNVPDKGPARSGSLEPYDYFRYAERVRKQTLAKMVSDAINAELAETEAAHNPLQSAEGDEAAEQDHRRRPKSPPRGIFDNPAFRSRNHRQANALAPPAPNRYQVAPPPLQLSNLPEIPQPACAPTSMVDETGTRMQEYDDDDDGDDDDEDDEDDQVEVQAPVIQMPAMPPVIWIRKADHTTRLRYVVQIININNEPYIKVDDNNLLYATYAEWLLNTDNTTLRQEQYRDWTSKRNAGRPDILFELFPIGQYDFTPANGRRKKSPHEFRPLLDPYGRVLLTGEHRPLKWSPVMPIKVSTEIEGWEMEALCRLDPNICHQDFVDRMVFNPLGRANGGTTKDRPSKGTLNHRRRRDRMRMRVLPWPVPRQLSYSDSQVVSQLDDWGQANNSTARLADLTKEEIEVQSAIMYGGHLERSGAHAQNDNVRLRNFIANLALVRKAFAEDSEEVNIVKTRMADQLRKMGLLQ